MTLISDIIRDAYRESNINAIGVAPTAVQQDEALRILNRIVVSTYGMEVGDQLRPIDLGRNNIIVPPGGWYGADPETNYLVPPNVRMMLNLNAPTTVYLSSLPQNGQRFGYVDTSNNTNTYPLTIVGNGRLIGGATELVINTGGDYGEYIYRDDLGQWLKINPLAYTDALPYPSELDDYFIVGLAMRLNPRNGAPIDPQSMEAYKAAERDVKATYQQVIQTPSELALIRTPGTWPNRYFGYGGNWGTDLFNAGYVYGWPFNY